MLLKMTRVQIVGMRAKLEATVAALHRLGVLHIEDAGSSGTLKGMAVDEASAHLQDELTYFAARLDALLHLLPAAAAPARRPDPIPPLAGEAFPDWLRRELDHIGPPLQALAQRRDELQAEAASLPRYEETLRKLAPLAIELHELDGFETAALLIERRYRDVLDLLRVEVERITHGRCEIIARDVDETTAAALLVYPRAFTAAVQGVLGQENITQVRLPKELAGKTFRDALGALTRREAAIRDELAQIEIELAGSALAWRASLDQWRREVQNRLQSLVTRSHFAATTYTFVVEGWVPAARLAALRQALQENAGPEVVVSELAISPADRERAPIAFANPGPLKPFELLVRTMALPRYGAFDPTPVLAIFLPLFFGVILGDVAYGALLFVLAWWVKRRFAANDAIRSLAQVLMLSAVWAVAFGFLYGEFLGTLGPAIGLKPLWIPREGEQILALFAFTLGLGVMQVVLGLLIAVWEAWRARQRSVLLAKAGMLLALSALFGMVGVATSFLPAHFFTPTVIALLLGLVLVSVPSGPLGVLLGPLEVLETVGNILSYLRLAAIGLSSVYLALVANQMAGLIGNVVVGVIVALLLHSLNFALGILSPTIQSLRLHYVEFFRQFYEGGGVEYRPFRME